MFCSRMNRHSSPLSIDSKSFSFGAAEEDALRRRIAEFATVNVRFWRNRDLPLGSRKVRFQAPAQSASVTNLGAKLPLRLAIADRLLSARMRTFLSSLPDHKSGH